MQVYRHDITSNYTRMPTDTTQKQTNYSGTRTYIWNMHIHTYTSQPQAAQPKNKQSKNKEHIFVMLLLNWHAHHAASPPFTGVQPDAAPEILVGHRHGQRRFCLLALSLAPGSVASKLGVDWWAQARLLGDAACLPFAA